MKSLRRLVSGWGNWCAALALFTAIPAVLIQCGVPALVLADDYDADTLGNPDLEFSPLPPPPPLVFGLGPARLTLKDSLLDASLRHLVSCDPVRPRPPPPIA